MTDLKKVIRRRTVDEVRAIRRRLVVSLEPGDVISFRELGRRRTYSAPISKVFTHVVRWNVEADRAAKKEAKKAMEAAR